MSKETTLEFALVERALNGEDGTTLFVCSMATPDRADDVIRQNWKLKRYRKNPVVLAGHNHSVVVGEVIEIKVPTKGKHAGMLMARVKWDVDSPDPHIAGIASQGQRGIRKAVSVGFRPGKETKRNELPPDHEHYRAAEKVTDSWGYTYEKVGTYYEAPELHELSTVSVPMHQDALAAKSAAAKRERESEADPKDFPALVRSALLNLLGSDKAVQRAIDSCVTPMATKPASLGADMEAVARSLGE